MGSFWGKRALHVEKSSKNKKNLTPKFSQKGATIEVDSLMFNTNEPLNSKQLCVAVDLESA